MQTTILDIKEHLGKKELVQTAFSFKPFVKYLKKRVDAEQTIKGEFYRFVLNKFKFYPHLETDTLTVKEAEKYTDVLELVYTILSPAVEDESKLFWALSSPVPSQIIYSTDAFFNFLTNHKANNKNKADNDGLPLFQDQQVDFIYRLILQKLYNFPSDISNDIIYSHADPDTGVCKYYRIHTDTNFIDVTAKSDLPDINPEMIEPFLYDGVEMDILQDIIPLSMFNLEGFAVITIDDVTADRSVENIRNALVNTNGQTDLYADVISSLQTLTGNNSIKFGLLPLLRVNGSLIFDTQECSNSILVKTAKQFEATEETYSSFNNYLEKPGAMFFSTLSEKKIEQFAFLKVIKQSGIKSYAMLPVYYNRKLTGILEIYSEQRVVFYEKLLSKLQGAIPLLAQLLQDSAEQFNLNLNEVIKTNFTTLQKPVEWKFTEAAWHYLIEKSAGTEEPDIEIVSFDNVYPLFGSIDIRDSTIKHNQALDNDISTIITALHNTVAELKKHLPKRLSNKMATAVKGWLKLFNVVKKSNDEIMFSNTLHGVVHPYLSQYRQKYPATEPVLNEFAKTINEQKGDGYAHRRALEVSIKQINSALNHYFEQAQTRLQKIYPCYFEKFRSDGVEYDIYTGQAIAPAVEFTPGHLKQFRNWQIKSMLDVALLANTLQSKMPVPLEVASLIFVHSSQINICFRNDERRFDVEGYYNIRYEVIKKRIDKVRIKETKQRLTQPGQISLVYFNDAEAQDYISYIKELQKEKKLKNDLHMVQLEELQGVTGLKALRVSVNYKI
ncbi:hypothetical protein ACFGVR_12600 [Mucilaginibacter sp. AW1-3]